MSFHFMNEVDRVTFTRTAGATARIYYIERPAMVEKLSLTAGKDYVFQIIPSPKTKLDGRFLVFVTDDNIFVYLL